VEALKGPMLESPLKQMRKDRKLRQSDLALLANVTQGHFSEVENGIAMPSDKLSRFLDAIDLDLLEAQKEFIRKMQIRAKRRSRHQLTVLRGGGIHGVKS
jgi:transcriptional regulator with XRE-family HTH domain